MKLVLDQCQRKWTTSTAFEQIQSVSIFLNIVFQFYLEISFRYLKTNRNLPLKTSWIPLCPNWKYLDQWKTKSTSCKLCFKFIMSPRFFDVTFLPLELFLTRWRRNVWTPNLESSTIIKESYRRHVTWQFKDWFLTFYANKWQKSYFHSSLSTWMFFDFEWGQKEISEKSHLYATQNCGLKPQYLQSFLTPDWPKNIQKLFSAI